jgi:cytochrome c oxidase subunit IV
MSEHPTPAFVVDAEDPNIPTDIEHKDHPPYLLVFASLAVLTAMEVGVALIPTLPHAPLLLAMMVVKVALVLLYFMHLKYDSKWFSFIFLIPFVLIIPFVIVTLIG